MDDSLPPPEEGNGNGNGNGHPITMWSFCHVCNEVVTPLVYISDDTWKFSFGKFLEVFFYNKSAKLCVGNCTCNMQKVSKRSGGRG